MKSLIKRIIIFACCLSFTIVLSAEEGEKKASAKAVIYGTNADLPVSGTITFTEAEGGLKMIAVLSNVTPAGKHGIHIHAGGSCGDGGKAAGGHFNPAKAPHGFLPQDGPDKAHAGDLGNIEIDNKGQGALTLFLPGLNIAGDDNNIVGHAIILDEKEDDFSQPTGNTGARIGCGTINLSK